MLDKIIWSQPTKKSCIKRVLYSQHLNGYLWLTPGGIVKWANCVPFCYFSVSCGIFIPLLAP